MYINGASAISPLPVFDAVSAGVNLVPVLTQRGKVTEPDYGSLIDPKLIRRMSRIIRMGVATAMDALKQAGIQDPDAILTGTAYGCLEDTGIFLKRLVENKEEMLTPTAFIQSTHNTVGAQVALLLKCHSYNNTYVQRSHSFELSLMDARLWLTENPGSSVLVGAADELTDYSYALLERFAQFRNQWGGEGAAYFLVQSESNSASWARIEQIYTLFQPDPEEITAFATKLSEGQEGIDLFLSGMESGDVNADLYAKIHGFIGKDIPAIQYKQYCGSYPTATAFACWLGAYWLKTGKVDTGSLLLNNPGRILIYQTDSMGYHSFILLKSC